MVFFASAGDLRCPWIHMALVVASSGDNVVLGKQRYENRWVEIEAYRLAADVRP